MKDLIFGMPSLIELDTLQAQIDLCQSLNLNFIELNMNLPQFQPESLSSSSLRALVRISHK